ncbi:MAG: hypothetical protein SGILL_004218 [Bacillariaceae sp.]
MVMAVAGSTPSAIARQGLALSSLMHHLQVAFKTTGSSLRLGGQKLRRGAVVSFEAIGEFLEIAFQTIGTKMRRECLKLKQGAVATFQAFAEFIEKAFKTVGTKMRRGGLKLKRGAVATFKAIGKDAPATLAASKSTPSSSPMQSSSVAPVMSRLTTASSTTTTSSSSPSWSSLSLSTSSAPIVTKTTPAKKESQALSNVSIKTLMSVGGGGSIKKNKKDANNLTVVPEPSLLGSMFSKLMGGLLILSSGALVGYLWSDFREERRHESMRNQEFVETIEPPVTRRVTRSRRAVPITPEASRY